MESQNGWTQERITIDLNILPALAQNLFGNDWKISIRELLQNSNDANYEAQMKIDNLQKEDLPIHVFYSQEKKTITIQDEGTGMTLNEVRENLATIGSGNKEKKVARNEQ